MQFATMFIPRARSLSAEGYFSTYEPDVYQRAQFGNAPRMNAFDFGFTGYLEAGFLVSIAVLCVLVATVPQREQSILRVGVASCASGLAILGILNAVAPGVGAMDFEVFAGSWVAGALAIAVFAAVVILLRSLPVRDHVRRDDVTAESPWIEGIPPAERLTSSRKRRS